MPAGYSRTAALVIFVASVATASLLIATVASTSPARDFGLYLSAILFQLFQASVYFVRLLFTSFREDLPAA